jgi:hypothetical protein
MFYKIVHHIVAVPTTILIPTDPRIRQFHPFTYRHLHAFKDVIYIYQKKNRIQNCSLRDTRSDRSNI